MLGARLNTTAVGRKQRGVASTRTAPRIKWYNAAAYTANSYIGYRAQCSCKDSETVRQCGAVVGMREPLLDIVKAIMRGRVRWYCCASSIAMSTMTSYACFISAGAVKVVVHHICLSLRFYKGWDIAVIILRKAGW